MNIEDPKFLVLEDILHEVLDLNNITAFPYKKISNTKYQFRANDLDICDVTFKKIDIEGTEHIEIVSDIYEKNYPKSNKLIYNVGYTINGKDDQFTITTMSVLIHILKTVCDITSDFINTKKPFGLFIYVIDKKGDIKVDTQKDMMYTMLAINHTPTDYRISRAKLIVYDTPFDGTLIFQNKIKK